MKMDFKKVLTSGWVPGTEFIIVKTVTKIVIGLVVLYLGYTVIETAVSEGLQEYKEIAEQNATAIVNEVSNNENNMQLPPLETLTKILNGAKHLSIEEKVIYFLEHKQALLNIMKNNEGLTAEELANMNEIIKYISNAANKANEIAIKNAAQNFMHDIKMCENFIKSCKK
jgi:hypothetical protein